MVLATPQVIVAALAGLSSLVLAVAALLLGRRTLTKWSFALGMAMFGADSFATVMLLGGPGEPTAHIFWFSIRDVARIVAPLAWIAYVMSFTRHHDVALPSAYRAWFAAGATLAVALCGAVLTLGSIRLSVVPGPFERAPLTGVGLTSVVFQLLLTMAVLVGLEACLRASRGMTRRQIKYRVVGLGGIFLMQFYVLSQVTLFRSITVTDLNIATAALLIGNIALAASLTRDRLSDVQLTVSRTLVHRSVIVGVLGTYLLAVGGLGWLLSYLRIPEKVFWVTVAVFVSALALAAVLLSEQARWRAKRFIALNFYRSKYDYREQWVALTRRLGTLLTLEDLSPELLLVVTEAVGSDAAMLYIADGSSRHYRLAGAIGIRTAPPEVQADSPLPAALAVGQGPLLLETGLNWAGVELAHTFPEGSVAVPLEWRGNLTGFLVVAPERTGVPYTLEDLEFMATMGQQATGSIVTAGLTEDLARAREFDAFARVASFVIHDLKNLIWSLSLLSQNAVKHIQDPEFQRDTIVTLSKTVERMQALLTKLSARAEPAALASQPVDVSRIVRDALGAVTLPAGAKLVPELGTVPPVLGDSDALLRVIQNLLTNAAQALDGEGTVAVTVRHEGGNTIVSIADTGCGMSEEFVRESLFVPFRTTKSGGWGIGLYQAKEIVERHGGALTVTSKEGSGTTFQVTLPTMSG